MPGCSLRPGTGTSQGLPLDSWLQIPDIGLAVNDRIKKDNQWVDETTFVDITLWSLGILVVSSFMIGQILRLGPHLVEVPISAMLVLGVGGWIIAKPHFSGSFDGLVFKYWAPPDYGDFLEVRLDSPNEDLFPRVPIDDGRRQFVGAVLDARRHERRADDDGPRRSRSVSKHQHAEYSSRG